jgi:phosphate ABC transporter phosphate-binding protein
VLSSAANICLAAPVEKLSQIKKIYVDSLGSNSWSAATRNRLIHRLGKIPNLQVVADAPSADAVLKGDAEIWQIGRISYGSHSHSPSEPVVQGYLSVEVVTQANETLWSYLVTPSKLPWGGVPDELASQVASRLLDAIKADTGRPAASAPTSLAKAALTGAGATFPAPLYRKWFQLYQEGQPAVGLHYDAVGSQEGIRRLRQSEVDFAASEVPLADEDMTSRRYVQLPMVLGAVVPIYNLKMLEGPLHFTPQILAGIYLGKIRKWNDPQIRRVNPGAALPDTDIGVTHRSDGSGTTYVWTSYLSKVSPEWKAQVSEGVKVAWPVGRGEEGNDGVAAAVQQTPNAIGYVEFIYAVQHELSFGAVSNAAGQFIKADIASVTTAARNSEGQATDLRAPIVNSPGKESYPIVAYTWILFPEKISDPDKTAVLQDLLRWMLTIGQKSCSALGYAPLPPDVARHALQSLESPR